MCLCVRARVFDDTAPPFKVLTQIFPVTSFDVKAGNCGPEGDPSLPKVDGVAHPQTALPAPGERDRAGLQNWPAFPERSHWSSAGKWFAAPLRNKGVKLWPGWHCFIWPARQYTSTANAVQLVLNCKDHNFYKSQKSQLAFWGINMDRTFIEEHYYLIY